MNKDDNLVGWRHAVIIRPALLFLDVGKTLTELNSTTLG
jgi:hypothetical protein